MRLSRLLPTFACLFLISGVSLAQEVKHPTSPFLWKIEGKELTKPSYLFGTIHLGSEGVTTLHPKAQKAFDSADAVYTEIAMDPASQLAIAQHTLREDGKTLNESIGEELADRLNEELKLINPLLDSTPFQPMATWVVGVSLPLLPEQLAGKKPLDALLWERAVAADKKTGALEELDAQISIFTEMSEEEQIIMLSETMKALKRDRAENRDSLKGLIEAYLSGDIDKLEAEMQRGMKDLAGGDNKELAAQFLKRLLTDRDITMAATIGDFLAKEPAQTHFFAAGAAHFSAETSIRSHLEKAGYTITRIKD